MSQADAKHGFAGFLGFVHHLNGIIHGVRVARTVTEEESIRIPVHHFFEGGFGRENAEGYFTMCEAVDDVLFDSIVEGSNTIPMFFPVIPSELQSG